MKIIYHIGRHDGGWAYRFQDVWSETFPTHDEALLAAKSAASRQHVGGRDAEITYQSEDGSWHSEHASGGDRPDTQVDDDDR